MIPEINKRETGIQLRRIMDKCGISVKDVQRYLGLGSVQSVYHWLNGISMPTVDNLYALSELFGLSVDAMLCGNRTYLAPEIDTRTSDCRRIQLYYEKLKEKRAA